LIAAHVWTCAALFFTLMLLFGLWRLRRRPAPAPPPTWPPIALLRPCEGAEPDLPLNLMSSLRAHYGGPRRVLFLVPDRADPAYAVATAVVQAAAAEGLADAAVVLTAPAPRQNRKVAQLVAGLQCCTEELVVTIDSDVRLGDADLPALVAALEADPHNAAAFAAPVEVAPQTLWDRASAECPAWPERCARCAGRPLGAAAASPACSPSSVRTMSWRAASPRSACASR
jgi:cellulose synthase/poly-beta-1,6-N-acetylglucosamine synthase-like glycosyltransferase